MMKFIKDDWTGTLGFLGEMVDQKTAIKVIDEILDDGAEKVNFGLREKNRGHYRYIEAYSYKILLAAEIAGRTEQSPQNKTINNLVKRLIDFSYYLEKMPPGGVQFQLIDNFMMRRICRSFRHFTDDKVVERLDSILHLEERTSGIYPDNTLVTTTGILLDDILLTIVFSSLIQIDTSKSLEVIARCAFYDYKERPDSLDWPSNSKLRKDFAIYILQSMGQYKASTGLIDFLKKQGDGRLPMLRKYLKGQTVSGYHEHFIRFDGSWPEVCRNFLDIIDEAAETYKSMPKIEKVLNRIKSYIR